MGEILLDDSISNYGGEFDIGLICSSSNQILAGNPLYKLSYGSASVNNKKVVFVYTSLFQRMRYQEDANAVKLNCTNKFVAVASESLAIFDLERDLSIRQLPDHNGDVTDVAWHHDSPYELASVSRVDGTLRTWDVRSHPAQTSVRRTQRPFSRVEYSPDSSFIACGGEAISIFDLNAVQSVVAINCGSYVTNITFNPAECLLASASEDRIVRFWDVDTGECVTQSIPFESVVHDMCFHPHGKYLICASAQQLSAILWEPFNVVAQLPKAVADTGKLWRTLHLSVHENQLLHLMAPTTSASKCYGSNSIGSLLAAENLAAETAESVLTNSIRLISLPLMELEQCVPKLTHAVMGCAPSHLLNDQFAERSTQQDTINNTAPSLNDANAANQLESAQLPSLLKRPSEIAISSSWTKPSVRSLNSSSASGISFGACSSSQQTPISPPLDVDNPFAPSHELHRESLLPVVRIADRDDNEDGSSISEGRISVASFSSSSNGRTIDDGRLSRNLTSPHTDLPTAMPTIGMALRPAPSIASQIVTGDTVAKSKVALARQRHPASSLYAAVKRSEKQDTAVHTPVSSLKHSQTNIHTSNDVNASPTKSSLKQLRSKSCSTNSKVVPHDAVISGSSSKSPAKTLNRRMSAVSVKSGQDASDVVKLEGLLRGSQKVHTLAKRRATELALFLANTHASNSDSFSETMVGFAAKQDDLRIFAGLLKIYLDHPKTYSLGMNIKFMEKVRALFAHQNASYVILALDLLEMTVRAFGDSIRHGLAAKCYTLGVDVAAEQRFEKCNRCRNVLLELRLNAPFLVERLDEAHRPTFNNMLSQIDRITSE